MKNSKQPAYPVIGAPGALEDDAGISKLELFAKAAMQGLLASGKFNPGHRRSMDSDPDEIILANVSIRCAEAMLKKIEANNKIDSDMGVE